MLKQVDKAHGLLEYACNTHMMHLCHSLNTRNNKHKIIDQLWSHSVKKNSIKCLQIRKMSEKWTRNDVDAHCSPEARPSNASHYRGRINHSGAPYQRKAGHFLIRVARIFPGRALFFSGVHFSFPKKLTTFLVVVVMFKPTLNVQTFKRQNSVVKIWQLIGGPLAAGEELPWYNRHNG